ncbi:hypothetical protein DKX38_025395 [Salix brachista]|uniref:Uncharacterized protein n=1 Tax=Salix brachista TaxID=2182728 RepID=A0A5N5JU99_9ROSI|nr:hypothetical protein DKX38_025389 [Salix brachista]KAB5521076.1 hypothetical protein DKX38_025395 [Salix brachista]
MLQILKFNILVLMIETVNNVPSNTAMLLTVVVTPCHSLLLTDVEFSGLVCRQLFNFSKVHVVEKMVGGVATLKIEQTKRQKR